MIPINELITKVQTRNVKSILSNVFVTVGGGSGAVSSVSGTANQISVSPITGAVVVSLPSSVIFPGTWAIGTLGYSDIGILFSAQSSTNSYNQAILQNTSNGSAASTNFNVSNDQGTASTNFGEFGINSSGFTGSGAFSTAGYVYLAAATTDLAIGTYSAKAIHFVVNMAATDAMTISGVGALTFNGSTTAIHKEIFNSLSTTITDGAGLWLANTTSAGSGAQQQSPYITLEGQGWNTTTTSSKSIKWVIYNKPIQGATGVIGGELTFASSIDGSAYSSSFKLSTGGNPVTSIYAFTSGASISSATNTVTLQAQNAATIGFQYNQASTTTIGNVQAWLMHQGFAPTSASSTWDAMTFDGTINQTGGANGAIWMLNIKPVYTAVAGVIRAFDYNPTETSISTHYFITSRSTTALSGFGISTPTALVHIGASTTARASLCIAHGSPPSSPVDGDFWTTTGGAFIRINGVTKTFTLT